MQMTVVGCAGSLPGPDSAASCYLIDTPGFRLVLDLGNGAVGQLQRYLSLDQVDAILLSHLHADHCLDMCGLSVAQTLHPAGPRRPIPVYAPPGAAAHLASALSPVPGTRMRQAFEFAELRPGSFEIGPLRVTAAWMNHPVETFGFRLEHDHRALVYSADTGPAPELVALAADADVLLCEASFVDGPGLPADLHLTARQAGLHATRAGVGEVVLTHLAAWNDPAVTLEQAASAFDGPLALARPGLQLPGGGDSPDR
jgi:ribonuclease BN (tRNA processing enzyme)